MITRRQTLNLAAGAIASGTLSPLMAPAAALAGARPFADAGAFADALGRLEEGHGGRICAAVHEPGTGRWHTHRGDDRVAMCSTHKLLTVAALLARVDRGRESLLRAVPVRRQDILSYAPVTRERAGGTMTLAELCDASITLSDNTAANLLFDAVGGPASVTAFVRSLGDTVTRLDRPEPDLNDVAAGDPRDTTTAVAFARTLARLSLGHALRPASRNRLNQWLVACKTGQRRIRGGLPAGWTAGDKTGSAGRKTNDVAVIWPPQRPPLIVTAFYDEGHGETAEARGAVLMEIGRIAVTL